MNFQDVETARERYHQKSKKVRWIVIAILLTIIASNIIGVSVPVTLIIALNDGKDSFEPPKASKPIDERAELAKIHADIKIITDFVNQLSLDRKLFKK